VLAAFLDAAVNDQSCGTDGQHDGEGHQGFLVVVEKLLEGAGTLGDFCKRRRGFWMIGGHDWGLPQLRKPDQSRDDGEINAEVG
jgi:hypothetical protein